MWETAATPSERIHIAFAHFQTVKPSQWAVEISLSVLVQQWNLRKKERKLAFTSPGEGAAEKKKISEPIKRII